MGYQTDFFFLFYGIFSHLVRSNLTKEEKRFGKKKKKNLNYELLTLFDMETDVSHIAYITKL